MSEEEQNDKVSLLGLLGDYPVLELNTVDVAMTAPAVRSYLPQ